MLDPETIKIQSDLARYCRNGKSIDVEGARRDRLPHYHRLVFNVLYGLMSKAFPIARSVLKEAEFKELIGAFLNDHDAKTPEVWKVPGEFYRFVSESLHPLSGLYPFLADLLHMEWMEINVFNSPEKAVGPYVSSLPSLSDVAVINPDREVLILRYPVHKGEWHRISEKRGEYRLVVFRNTETKKVHFTAISPLHHRLIDFLAKGNRIDPAIRQALAEHGLDDSAKHMDQLSGFVKAQFKEGLILGRK